MIQIAITCYTLREGKSILWWSRLEIIWVYNVHVEKLRVKIGISGSWWATPHVRTPSEIAAVNFNIICSYKLSNQCQLKKLKNGMGFVQIFWRNAKKEETRNPGTPWTTVKMNTWDCEGKLNWHCLLSAINSVINGGGILRGRFSSLLWPADSRGAPINITFQNPCFFFTDIKRKKTAKKNLGDLIILLRQTQCHCQLRFAWMRIFFSCFRPPSDGTL